MYRGKCHIQKTYHVAQYILEEKINLHFTSQNPSTKSMYIGVCGIAEEAILIFKQPANSALPKKGLSNSIELERTMLKGDLIEGTKGSTSSSIDRCV